MSDVDPIIGSWYRNEETGLDFEVVAEGVETIEQSDFLAGLGCEQLQGHLHGKAVSAPEFRARWSTPL